MYPWFLRALLVAALVPFASACGSSLERSSIPLVSPAEASQASPAGQVAYQVTPNRNPMDMASPMPTTSPTSSPLPNPSAPPLTLTGTVPVLGDSVSNNPWVTEDGDPVWAQLLQQTDPAATYQILATAGVKAAYVLDTEVPQVAVGCTYAFMLSGINDYNVRSTADATDWPTVENEILRSIDILHGDCHNGPVVIQTYAYNVTEADVRYSLFARLNAFYLNIVKVGTRPWVIMVDQNADPRFHQHDNYYMLNDAHENAAGQYVMQQNIENAVNSYVSSNRKPAITWRHI